MEMYQELHKWDEAIAVAEAKVCYISYQEDFIYSSQAFTVSLEIA